MDFEAQIRANLDTTNAQKSFDSFKKNLQNDIIKINIDANLLNSNSNALNNLLKQFSYIGKAANKSFSNELHISESPTIKEFTNYKKSLKSQIADVSKEMQSSYRVNQKDAEKWSNQYVTQNVNTQKKAAKEQIRQIEKTARQVSQIRENTLNGAYDAKSSTFSSKLSSYANQNSELINKAREQTQKYDDTLQNLKKHFDSNDAFLLDDSQVVSSFESMNNAAKMFDNTMKQIQNTQSKDLDLGVAERSANLVAAYSESNTKALKKYGIELKDLENQYRNIKTEEEKSALDNTFKNLRARISAEGLTGKSFFNELGRGFKQIGQFATTYGVIQEIPEKIGQAVLELKEMDNILTEISKTSDLTTSELKELGQSSFDSASKYGKTASDYLTGVQEMSRSGFYGKQAEQLAELSILGQAAGDMSRDVSNSYLLATNAAYGYEGSVEKLNAVLDGQNMITNRNSVSMNDMAQATSEAASMAAETGVAVDQLSAMIGTMEARTKSGGAEVGNAIKAILINLQNTSSDKIVNTLDKAGASMTEYVNGVEQLRNPIEILEDLAETYNSLEENDPLKSEILTNIGQKYHANKLSALLSGWDDYEKMLSDYSMGDGSAAIEAEKSANNWTGSINKLSNAWTELIQNFADSDTIITVTNMLTGLTNGVDDVLSSLGGFKTLFSLLGGGWATKTGLGKRNADPYKIKQNYRRYINVGTSVA